MTHNPYGGWPPPGYVHPEPPAPAAPIGSVEYHLIQRAGAEGWWRPAVGVVSLALSFFVVPAILGLVLLVILLTQGDSVEEATNRFADTDNVTPLVLGFLNVSLAALIPVCLLLTWLLHRLRPGWLSSVAPRLRWGWMAACFGLAFVALVVTVVVATLLPSAGEAAEMSGELNEWTTTTRDFVLVIVLLTPLQAAGEEYAFRGYLTQAFGGIFAPLGPQAGRAAAVLLPAVLFALAHGAQDAPVFVDRLAFGLVAGVLVITTGGLEAGIAMHVLNNFLAYGFALAYSDMTSALNPSGGSWWQLPVTLTQSLAYLGLATWVARRMGVARTTSVLEGSERRV
ncbi:lysostaphin resistance A-like protein [Nocardioides dilutus]